MAKSNGTNGKTASPATAVVEQPVVESADVESADVVEEELEEETTLEAPQAVVPPAPIPPAPQAQAPVPPAIPTIPTIPQAPQAPQAQMPGVGMTGMPGMPGMGMPGMPQMPGMGMTPVAPAAPISDRLMPAQAFQPNLLQAFPDKVSAILWARAILRATRTHLQEAVARTDRGTVLGIPASTFMTELLMEEQYLLSFGNDARSLYDKYYAGHFPNQPGDGMSGQRNFVSWLLQTIGENGKYAILARNLKQVGIPTPPASSLSVDLIQQMRADLERHFGQYLIGIRAERKNGQQQNGYQQQPQNGYQQQPYPTYQQYPNLGTQEF